MSAPLADKIRPKTLDDVVGSKMNKTAITLLLLLSLSISTVGCGNPSTSSLSSQIETSTTPEVKTTQTTTAETTVTLTLEKPDYNQRQILEAICIDMYGTVPPFSEDDDHVDYLMNTAEYVSKEPFGSIADNEDAIEKARVVWIEYLGSDYIEKIESDFVDVNGEPMHYERDNPPYEVNYYDEYDVWLVNPIYPSGIREDGVKFASPGTETYLIIRGSDGKILGAFL